MPDIRRESSASKLLQGLEYQGKKIESVWVEGKGARRVIVFSDGSTRSSNKDKVSALARIQGTLNQLKKYHKLDSVGRKKALETSRQRQHVIKQTTTMRLVDQLSRAKNQTQKKLLRDRIRQVITHPIESPLVTGKSIIDVSRRGSEVRKDVKDAKNVRWVTIRRGRRYVRIPIEDQRWALRLRAPKKPKKA